MSAATPEADGSATVRLRLDLAYDGGAFSGWAEQPGLRTVAGELSTWLPRVLRVAAPVPLVCAGRTDAGVHARGQVAHVDVPAGAGGTDSPESLAALLRRRLDRVLPADVAVRDVRVAPAGFDARFSAVWRRYVYRLWDAPGAPDPLRRHEIARHRGALDVAAMNDAATRLVGLRDFATFCRKREGATTIRTLLDLTATRRTARPLAGLVEVTVRADAFCHSMVRALVGGLTVVGSGRREAAWLVAAADAAARDPHIPVLPACGLTLEEVGYPADDELARRAQESRALRVLPGAEAR